MIMTHSFDVGKEATYHSRIPFQELIRKEALINSIPAQSWHNKFYLSTVCNNREADHQFH